jgi:hypothetical protein
VTHVKNITNSDNSKRIEKYVKELADLEGKCRLIRSRDWAIPYLERVYELHTNWKKKELGKQRRMDLISLAFGKKPVRKNKKLLHVIIACTSKEKPKTQSRWVGALLAARAKNIEPERIKNFLLKKDKGGIAGRAAEYAVLREAKKQAKRKTSGKAAKLSVPHKKSPQKKGNNARPGSDLQQNRNNEWD